MFHPHGSSYCSFTIVLPKRKFSDVKHMDPFYCCMSQESLLSYPHGSFYCLSQLFYQKGNSLIVKHMVPLLLLNKLGNLYCTTHMLSSIVLQITPTLLLSYMLLSTCYYPFYSHPPLSSLFRKLLSFSSSLLSIPYIREKIPPPTCNLHQTYTQLTPNLHNLINL